MNLIILSSSGDLPRYFQKATSQKPFAFVYLEKGYHPIVETLKQRGGALLPNPVWPEGFAERFIHEFNDVMGHMGQANNNRLWWATDMASKNCFSSQLPFLLEQFVLLLHLIDEHQHQSWDLLIIGPQDCIVSPLLKCLKARKIPYHYYGQPLKIKIKSRLLGLARSIWMLRSAWMIWSRAKEARKQLRVQVESVLSLDKEHYVIKTFIYNHSFDTHHNYKDVFFGKLPQYLKTHKEVLILANILGDYARCLKEIKDCQDQQIVPYEYFLSLSDILKAMIEKIFGRIHVDKHLRLFDIPVWEVIEEVLIRTFKGVQLVHFLHYWATQHMIRRIRVGTFLLTYENYPWERMCIMVLRLQSPQTRIVGYQHTVVPEACLNMYVGTREDQVVPQPQMLLTAGDAPRKIMERLGISSHVQVKSACGLRFEYLFGKSFSQERRPIKNILIPMEGQLDAFPIVQYAINQLKGNAFYHVRIRTHPFLPWAAYEKHFRVNLSAIANFEVSQVTSLTGDLEWADLILYWSTTVALEALMIGKPVLHFDQRTILRYDPLFQCSHFRAIVSPDSSLEKTIQHFEQMPLPDWNMEKEKARCYIQSYFHPVNLQNLEKFD
jgi:hypothetical protein